MGEIIEYPPHESLRNSFQYVISDVWADIPKTVFVHHLLITINNTMKGLLKVKTY